MKLFEKKDVIRIEEDDLRDAKLSSIDFPSDKIRKRAFINVLGARLAMKMLFSQKIEANNLYSLYTIHKVIEELDIADIYSEGIKIDVRLVFNREEIFIPKSHFEYDLVPDLYLVLELDEEFSSAELLGFFEPRTLNKLNANRDFYFYEYDRLNDPKDLKTFLSDFIVERNFDISENDSENIEELFLKLADNEISKNDKQFLLKHLANNIDLREKMVEFENFEILSKEIAKNKALFQDDVLDIIGTQKLFDGPDADNYNPSDVEYEIAEDDGGLDALAVGMGIGGAIVGGAAGAAAAGVLLEQGLAKSELDALSSGLELGNELVESGAQAVSAGINLGNELFGELPELEELVEEGQETSSNEEVFDLDDFDFNMLNETDSDSQSNDVDSTNSFEQATSQNVGIEQEENEISEEFGLSEKLGNIEGIDNIDDTDNTEIPQQFKMLENVEPQEQSDEFISQVDEFLKDIELSDEQKEMLKNSLPIEDLEKNIEENYSQVPEINYSQSEASGSEEDSGILTEEFENKEDKDLLKVLFKKEKMEEIPEELTLEEKRIDPPTTSSKYHNKKMVVAASVASVVLASLVIGSSMLHNKNNEIKFPKNMTTAPISAEGQTPTGLPQDNVADTNQNPQALDQSSDPLAQQAVPDGNQQAGATRDMGKAVSDAFLSEPVNASISKVAWEVPEELAYNDSFRKYLQVAGKNLKLNLQNDLLLATEMAYSNKVVVDLVINRDGSLQSENVAASSGSKQIDKIVLQSVKETLKYLKMPSSELKGGSANATLIINF